MIATQNNYKAKLPLILAWQLLLLSSCTRSIFFLTHFLELSFSLKHIGVGIWSFDFYVVDISEDFYIPCRLHPRLHLLQHVHLLESQVLSILIWEVVPRTTVCSLKLLQPWLSFVGSPQCRHSSWTSAPWHPGNQNVDDRNKFWKAYKYQLLVSHYIFCTRCQIVSFVYISC